MIKTNKKASSLALVIIFISLLSVVSVTVFVRYRQQKVALSQIDEHLKADWVAKGLVQLILFKIKLLPSTFYETDVLHKTLLSGTGVTGGDVFIDAWYSEFMSLSAHTLPLQGDLDKLALEYLKTLPDYNDNDYDAWVRRCIILEKSPGGYTKDLLRINVEVKINGRTREYEELVEINRYGL